MGGCCVVVGLCGMAGKAVACVCWFMLGAVSRAVIASLSGSAVWLGRLWLVSAGLCCGQCLGRLLRRCRALWYGWQVGGLRLLVYAWGSASGGCCVVVGLCGIAGKSAAYPAHRRTPKVRLSRWKSESLRRQIKRHSERGRVDSARPEAAHAARDRPVGRSSGDVKGSFTGTRIERVAVGAVGPADGFARQRSPNGATDRPSAVCCRLTLALVAANAVSACARRSCGAAISAMPVVRPCRTSVPEIANC